MAHKVLIATTTWWPQAARLAIALAEAGVEVAALCPRGSPVERISSVRQIFTYAAFRPIRVFAEAIRATRPDLIIPCDERTVGHLHALHADSLRTRGVEAADFVHLIERSVGSADAFAITRDRGAVLAAAADVGVLIPNTQTLASAEDVRAWCAAHSLPALLKTSGSWGGSGVALVESADAAVAAYRRMSRPIATWRAAKFLVSNRDPFPAAEWLQRQRSSVIAQSLIQGRPANTMVACWKGEVLACVSVKALDTAKQFGAATVIQLVAEPQMEQAARLLVRRLGLSGFCGLDFVIQDGTGDAYLIEVNARATQLGHLRAHGATLAGVLADRVRGVVPASTALSAGSPEIVALFPQAWLSASAAPLLHSSYHDIPWEEPELVAELLKRPWDIRGPVARLVDFVLRRCDPSKQLAALFGTGELAQSRRAATTRCSSVADAPRH